VTENCGMGNFFWQVGLVGMLAWSAPSVHA